ncbi:uncharacterized protein A4U43_C04F8880 [Asparagus officinalis]|uniref:Uncharacterized protein n=1 Tax=Asparagus officinalis TaxID=4686 RepID=A0A5P1F3V0_ASPOF|nr:transcription factor LAF1-like [Asparagus officinalis]ONK71459.1 uncharacterized protein A4U43_C04F8880 [Asparagus officinalis]
MGCRTCEKPKVNYRKGLWSPEEDQRLRNYVLKHGHGCWSSVPVNAGLQRNGKSCRLRWINYLRPGLKRGMFSHDEEEIVMKLHVTLGNKWSQIAMHLPGRTDNEVKNYWNSYLKKRVNPHASSSKSKDSTNQNINQITASESVDSGRSVSVNTDQGLSKGTSQTSALPKIIFADWLSTDHALGASSCQWDSNPQTNQGFQEGIFPVHGQSGGDFLHGFLDSNVYGELQLQFQNESQLQGGELFDLFSMGEISGDLNVNNDVIY